jgi:hypothetical protein
MENNITWAYIAGFLDGDGWICITKDKDLKIKNCMIGFTQKSTEEKYMKKIFDFLQQNGINSIFFKRIVINKLVPKKVEMINIYVKKQESVVKLLENILPFILIKKEKANEAYLHASKRLKLRGHGSILPTNCAKRFWKKEEIEMLKSMKAEGYNRTAIAVKLNRSIDSITRKYFILSKSDLI